MRSLFLSAALAFAWCSPLAGQNTGWAPQTLPVSTDSTYGYTKENPIRVGGLREEWAPARQHYFLMGLRGPHGEAVTYERLGSCCAYDTPDGILGKGMLDQYEVTCEGRDEPVLLYLTLYDFAEPRVPVGFTWVKPGN